MKVKATRNDNGVRMAEIRESESRPKRSGNETESESQRKRKQGSGWFGVTGINTGME